MARLVRQVLAVRVLGRRGEVVGSVHRLVSPPTGRGRRTCEPELGYRLRREVWGQGYATEGSRALVDKAFGELGVERVYASTMAVNVASRRVMEKAGMRYVRTFDADWPVRIPGDEEGDVEYAIDRADGRPTELTNRRSSWRHGGRMNYGRLGSSSADVDGSAAFASSRREVGAAAGRCQRGGHRRRDDVCVDVLFGTWRTTRSYGGSCGAGPARVAGGELANIVWSYEGRLDDAVRVGGLISLYLEWLDLFVDGEAVDRVRPVVVTS